MRLTDNDQKELEKRLKRSTFEKLFLDLIFLKPLRYPGLVVTGYPTDGSGADGLLSPEELIDGFTLRFVVAPSKGIPIELAEELATKLKQEAESLASRLAFYFPENRHRHWHTIFTLLAINEDAAGIVQRQRGGAPSGMKEKTKKNYEDLAKWYHGSGSTQAEFCRAMNISRSRLNRALKFVSRKR